jgi:hypothetical protein
MVWPVFAMVGMACWSGVLMVISRCPPGTLWRTAWSIRLAIRRLEQSWFAGGRSWVERGVDVEIEGPRAREL